MKFLMLPSQFLEGFPINEYCSELDNSSVELLTIFAATCYLILKDRRQKQSINQSMLTDLWLWRFPQNFHLPPNSKTILHILDDELPHSIAQSVHWTTVKIEKRLPDPQKQAAKTINQSINAHWLVVVKISTKFSSSTELQNHFTYFRWRISSFDSSICPLKYSKNREKATWSSKTGGENNQSINQSIDAHWLVVAKISIKFSSSIELQNHFTYWGWRLSSFDSSICSLDYSKNREKATWSSKTGGQSNQSINVHWLVVVKISTKSSSSTELQNHFTYFGWRLSSFDSSICSLDYSKNREKKRKEKTTVMYVQRNAKRTSLSVLTFFTMKHQVNDSD